MTSGNTGFVPSMEEFIEGVRVYRQQEERDAVYKIARYLVEELFKAPKDEQVKGRTRAEWTTDAVGTLLLVWNWAFYRYGPLNFYKFQKTVEKYYQNLISFRNKSIEDLSLSYENKIKEIFIDFAEATSINVKGKQRFTPVGVAKALHLFAPNFFPLWDQKIAKSYGYSLSYGSIEEKAKKYVNFMLKIKKLLSIVKSWNIPSDVLEANLKSIDEFNYAKYTKNWIKRRCRDMVTVWVRTLEEIKNKIQSSPKQFRLAYCKDSKSKREIVTALDNNNKIIYCFLRQSTNENEVLSAIEQWEFYDLEMDSIFLTLPLIQILTLTDFDFFSGRLFRME